MTLLYDPPGLTTGHGDPPMNAWPGRRVTEDDVAAACGDGRDWFRFGHRLQAHRDAWHRFRQARKRRRNYFSGFKFSQVLIIGDLGAKKSTLADWEAYKWFQRGHPVFSNGPTLFGWRLEGEDIFTALARVPKNSVVIIDEGHAALQGRLVNSTAVSTFVTLTANARKRNCKTLIMSALDRDVARKIREMCSEVWRPFTPEVDTTWAGAQANNPANFILAWDEWHEFPYRLNDLIEGPKPNQGYFGKPDRTLMASGESVRNAFLTTDSFQDVDAGAAVLANRNVVKGDLAAIQGGGNGNGHANGLSGPQIAVLEFLDSYGGSGGEDTFIRAGEISQATGLDLSLVGKTVGSLFNVQNVRNKGYSTQLIMEQLPKYVDPD